MLLKDLYSPAFYATFSETLEAVVPSFNRQQFLDLLFDGHWERRELKERMKHTTKVLHHFLPQDFAEAAHLIRQIVLHLQERSVTEMSLEFMFLPDYIETYGLEEFEASVAQMELVTQFTSCEFAVRPFLVKYQERMYNQMLLWSQHENHKVRRLASEGIRPRLPWAMALPLLKKNPQPILPILENLKDDASLFVRKSVANNINDIAKDNPEVVLNLLRSWKNKSAHTDWILKHGSRTLLKQGHPEVLGLFGIHHNGTLTVEDLTILTPTVAPGEDLVFSFRLTNTATHSQKIRLEFALYYCSRTGKERRKVYKISEKALAAGAANLILKKQSFKPITTRSYYAGTHQLAIIVNGQEQEKQSFELVF